MSVIDTDELLPDALISARACIDTRVSGYSLPVSGYDDMAAAQGEIARRRAAAKGGRERLLMWTITSGQHRQVGQHQSERMAAKKEGNIRTVERNRRNHIFMVKERGEFDMQSGGREIGEEACGSRGNC